MSEQAYCAHLNVSYRTEELPNFGTHGWWACDCGRRFAPISNTASDGERVRLFIRTGAQIPRNDEEVRKEVLAELGYTDQPAPIPTWWPAYQSAAQQARCPECRVPLDFATPHVSGCAWQMEQGRMAQNSTRTYGNELTNAYRPEVEMSREELKGRYSDATTCPECGYHPGEHGMHRESCETGRMRAYRAHEPAPASWWSRVRAKVAYLAKRSLQ